MTLLVLLCAFGLGFFLAKTFENFPQIVPDREVFLARRELDAVSKCTVAVEPLEF